MLQLWPTMMLRSLEMMKENQLLKKRVAELEAQLMGGAGVLITQHDYWSFTVVPTFEVPFGQRSEQRQWLSFA